MSELKPEHGTLQAYVTGFILSLVFTFIPYYLVVHQVATGTKLLVVILTFGVLQMMVQLLFFLHLGRRPRPHWQIIFLAGTVFAVLVVTGGSVIIINNLHSNMTPTEQVLRITNDEGIYQVGGKATGACEALGANHQVIVANGIVAPGHVSAQRCDTLTFTNKDSGSKDIHFGTVTHQTPYAGVNDYSVSSSQNKTITLSEVGNYQFYDSRLPATTGSFSVHR